MMVLVLAAAVWTGCTQENPVVSEEQVSEEQHTTVQFTATLEGKGGEATKALSSDGTTTWAVDEEIALYYQTTSSYATATATVTSVDASGNATISATLTDAADNGTVKFVYPAFLHNGSGGISSNLIQLYQTGNLTGTNSISEYYDAATGDGTLTVSGDNASLSSAVSMTNPLCICKFQFYLTNASGASTSTIDAYTIKYIVIDAVSNETGSKRYYVNSDRTSGDSVRDFNQEEDIYLAMYPANGEEFTFTAVVKSGLNTKVFTKTISNVTLEENKFYNNISSLALALNNSVSAPAKASVYRGNLSSSITVSDGEIICLYNTTYSASSGPAIICEGDATITLEGSNTVSTSARGYPAIQAGPSGKTLIIQGSGSLSATGDGGGGAGIGSGQGGTCGNISISGGTVTATGEESGAGIGSGYQGTCENITISGGEVTATGGEAAAGIGSGWYSTCGDITISGGEVTATGGDKAAGIGSGYYYSTCGNITISGGEVTATGGDKAAGIGSGSSGKFISITIGSGITSVTATMGSNAQAPIGQGNNDQGSGSVTINNLNCLASPDGKTWTLTPKSQN